MLNIASIVGARPQFVKLAPVCRAMERCQADVEHTIVHTGQHYDSGLSDVFFAELEIPRPDISLHVGSGPHGRQTASMLEAIETEFEKSRPDVALVYGDTNSTLAATLAASKMHIPVAHIEAGLRSFDRTMPEEINRLVADHCADRLYAPTTVAMANLHDEGLSERSVLTGDVMLDAVQFNATLAEGHADFRASAGLEAKQYGIVTLHRPSNTEAGELKRIMQALERIAEQIPLVFPVHPRTRAVLEDQDIVAERVRLVEPLGYLNMLDTLRAARLALTDSGGLQKEAAMLGTPCVTLRDETEWTETVEMGANRLVGRSSAELELAVTSILSEQDPSWEDEIENHYGDGDAAGTIVNDLIAWQCGTHRP